MHFFRIFSGEAYKGTKGYLKTQKVYEILRTVLYFGISLSLFAGGYLTTGTRLNLLTIVAILGCLPASKSAVSAVMFCRFKGLDEESAAQIEPHTGSLLTLYDMVFTGYEKNFVVEHMAVRGSQVRGYASAKDFDRQAFLRHMEPLLKADSFSHVNIKISLDKKQYIRHLEELQTMEDDPELSAGIAATLKSVSL